MKKNWHGLMKIIDIQHVRGSKVIWEQKNIYNYLHTLGEEFLLKCCFATDATHPPAQYYFGLDNRSSINIADTMTSVTNEAIGSGYSRRSVSSSSGFTIEQIGGVYRAASQIITFTSSGNWTSVNTLFLTNLNSNSGTLISSASLSSAVSLQSGDSVNMRMSLSLQDVSS